MVSKIAASAFIIIFILFLLSVFVSVFGPMNSRKKFWIVIRKIRYVMDICSYWFYNLCAIAVILYVVCLSILGLQNYLFVM